MSRPEDPGRHRPMRSDGPLRHVPESTVRALCRNVAQLRESEGYCSAAILRELQSRGWRQLRRPPQVRAMYTACLRIEGRDWTSAAARSGYATRDAAWMAVRRLFAEQGRPALPAWFLRATAD